MSEEDDIIHDLENHITYEILKEYKEKGVTSEKEYEKFLDRFSRLHKCLLRVLENESAYLNKAKSLKQELIQERKKYEEVESVRTQNNCLLQDLKRDLAKAETQLSVSQESESMYQSAQIELDRSKSHLEDKIRRIKEEKEEKERPIVEHHQTEINQIQKEIQTIREKYKKEEQNVKVYAESILQLKKTIENLKIEKSKNSQHIKEIETEPEKARKQNVYVCKARDASIEELKAKTEKLKELEKFIGQLESEKEKIEEDILHSKRHEEGRLLDSGKEQKLVNELEKRLRIARKSKQDIYATIVNLDLNIEAKVKQHKEEIEKLKRLKHEEDELINKIEAEEKFIAATMMELDKRQKKFQMCEKDLEDLKHMHNQLENQKKELEKDLEILLHDYILDSNVSKDFAQKLKDKRKELSKLEETVTKMSAEEKVLSKSLLELGVEREKMAREATRSKQLYNETMGEVKVKVFVNNEIMKKYKELERKFKALLKLYTVTKQERNKYAKGIQENAQLIAEIHAKNKILEDELEVYTKQSINYEKELNNAKRQKHEEEQLKQKMLKKTSKLKLGIKNMENETKEQGIEIDKLITIIDVTEKDMLLLKDQYEHGVQDRNFTGIQLSDRNDELCILYEKANIQEEKLKNGEVELRRKEQETQAMKLELSDLQRELRVVHRCIPEVKAMEQEKVVLEQEITSVRANIEKLSQQLENPENRSRWRELGGSNPTDEQLKEKIHQLEEKLNTRKEQLMEKNLVLQEVTKSSDKLRKLAISGREHTYDLAIGINQIQSKIREANRKMMACMSELSIYQATSKTLEDNNKRLAEHIEECRKRMDRGEPPSKEIEEQFLHYCDMEMRHKAELMRRKEREDLIKELPPTITRTTAIVRPGAYIPDDELGIPRPYFMKPFMYSEPGSNMRHYKKPQPKQVIL